MKLKQWGIILWQKIKRLKIFTFGYKHCYILFVGVCIGKSSWVRNLAVFIKILFLRYHPTEISTYMHENTCVTMLTESLFAELKKQIPSKSASGEELLNKLQHLIVAKIDV